ncbi:hypothetical protein C8R46DRAFT_1037154 [Mycena filopes]|nr:hypothetical protein C8R46DRAFT_1037154 [Mycena filopes]
MHETWIQNGAEEQWSMCVRSKLTAAPATIRTGGGDAHRLMRVTDRIIDLNFPPRYLRYLNVSKIIDMNTEVDCPPYSDSEDEEDEPIRPGYLAQYFDLIAAVDTDAGEDEDEESAHDRDDGTIEERMDAPRRLPRPSSRTSVEPETPVAELQQRARERRYAESAPPLGYIVPSNVPEIMDRMACLPGVSDPELYMLKVPRGREFNIVVAIGSALNTLIPSASFIPSIPGFIYLETTDLPTLHQTAQQHGAGKPILVRLEEHHHIFPGPPASLKQGWARVIEPVQYKGDLALVIDEVLQTYLVVPRESRASAAQLFLPPPEVPSSSNGLFQFGGNIYASGALFAHAHSSSHLAQVDIIPTEAEMAPFRVVRHPKVAIADDAPGLPAVAPGDRVVVRKGAAAGVQADLGWKDLDSGWVVAVEMIDNKRIAAVSRVWPPAKGECFFIRARHLTHHLLGIPRRLNLQERITVVIGGYTGRTGRVVALTDGFVTLDAVSSQNANGAERLRVHPSQVMHAFMLGDWVEIVRGKHQGMTGFIVNFCDCGAAEVCHSSVVYKNLQNGDEIALDITASLREPRNFGEEYTQFRKMRILRVQTHSLVWIGDDGTALSAPTRSVPRSTFEEPEQLLTRSDQERRGRILRMLRTGTDFAGRAVRIQGKNIFKGQYGDVKGWSLKKPRSDAKGWQPDDILVQKMLFKGEDVLGTAEVQIRLEGRPAIVSVPMRDVFDRDTGLPLMQAATAPRLGPLRDRTPPPDLAADTQWRTPFPLPAKEQAEIDAQLAEENGDWLSDPRLWGQRIDVVSYTAIIHPQWVASFPQRSKKTHGQNGYIILPGGVDLKKKKIQAQLGVSMHRYNIPADNLRPERTMYRNEEHMGREPIGGVQVRVIVIGPDHLGVRDFVGQYGLVMPDAVHEHGSCVQIKLSTAYTGGTLRYGYFPSSSLCRSLNRQPPSPPLSRLTQLPVRVTSPDFPFE